MLPTVSIAISFVGEFFLPLNTQALLPDFSLLIDKKKQPEGCFEVVLLH